MSIYLLELLLTFSVDALVSRGVYLSMEVVAASGRTSHQASTSQFHSQDADLPLLALHLFPRIANRASARFPMP